MDLSKITHEEHCKYIEQCRLTATMSGCLRRKYGALILRNDKIIVAMATNRSPYNTNTCIDLHQCNRANVPRGTQYELCRSVHAEANCIITADAASMCDSVMYLVGLNPDDTFIEDAEPCYMCKRLIINANISYVIVGTSPSTYRIIDVLNDWVYDDVTLKPDTYIKT